MKELVYIKNLLICGLLLILASCGSGDRQANDNNKIAYRSQDSITIEFKDSNLRECVRKYLNKLKDDPITVKDMESIDKLNCTAVYEDQKINSIDELQYCKSITALTLNNNNISDLMPLRYLKNLKHLNLKENKLLKDLTPLDLLPSIELINIDKTAVTAITPLMYRYTLKSISAVGTGIQDLINILLLYSLGELDLSDNNNLNDLKILPSLTSLRALRLKGNNITDISFLRQLFYVAPLEGLDLSNNKLTDIFYLRYGINLKDINISNNQISDISQLRHLKSFSIIDLSNNKIKDISVLNNIADLEYVYLSGNCIDDTMINKLKDKIGATRVINNGQNPEKCN